MTAGSNRTHSRIALLVGSTLLIALAVCLAPLPAMAEDSQPGLAGVTIYLDRIEVDGAMINIQPVALPLGNPARAQRTGRAGRGSIEIRVLGDASKLAASARSKQRVPTITGYAKNPGGGAQPLQYELERCFIKSWSTSGDADAPPTGPYFKIEFESVQMPNL
jgi:hypothetical protein